jgi:hypothetical protein
VWHNRVKKARGPASGYVCADCGGPAEDWSTVNPLSNDVRIRFQPRCRKCHRHYDGGAGEGNPRAKLTSGKVRELRARRADGLTYQQLAAEFGISDVSAWAAVTGKTWAHVSLSGSSLAQRRSEGREAELCITACRVRVHDTAPAQEHAHLPR